MNTLGSASKTVIKKMSSDMLTQGFEQTGLKYTITLDADLVASNVIAGYIGGATITKTYATSHAASMTALAALIAAADGVLSASVTSARVITIVPENQIDGLAVVGWAVTAGASQAGVVVASTDGRCFPGMQVELDSTGKVQPVTAATADLTNIGTVIDHAQQDANGIAKEPKRVTVALRGSGVIINAKASISPLAVGPVASAGFDSSTGYPKVTSSSVTVTNQIGWAIDAGTSVGDIVRVILK